MGYYYTKYVWRQARPNTAWHYGPNLWTQDEDRNVCGTVVIWNGITRGFLPTYAKRVCQKCRAFAMLNEGNENGKR